MSTSHLLGSNQHPTGGSVVCSSCEHENKPGYHFCVICGSPLQAVAAATTSLLPGAPEAPESIADVGVRPAILEDLALKILFVAGPLSLRELSAYIRLRYPVVNDLLRRLRLEQLCEITGMAENMPHIAITSAGRSRALELLSQNHYAGPAPVSLPAYVEQVQRQSVRHTEIHPPDVERAFSHLVLDRSMLRKLGTALNSGTSIFLYGPSGSGKTTVATALSRVLALDEVWVPFAVEVDGQIISLYDPHLHSKIDRAAADIEDQRWVLCHRPTVLVGGELTMEMLELQLNPTTRFYAAPMQMKANNGVLIIDDFGRQRMRPEELLNRWVVPLDRRIDFLTLAGGKQVEIPFEMFVVFATNLDPATLADPAFLRRIQTKIEVGGVSDEQFHEIFRSVCDGAHLKYEIPAVDELIHMIRHKLREPLRACHPRDLVNQILWGARYEQREPTLDPESLLAAVQAYFVSGNTDLQDAYAAATK